MPNMNQPLTPSAILSHSCLTHIYYGLANLDSSWFCKYATPLLPRVMTRCSICLESSYLCFSHGCLLLFLQETLPYYLILIVYSTFPFPICSIISDVSSLQTYNTSFLSTIFLSFIVYFLLYPGNSKWTCSMPGKE